MPDTATVEQKKYSLLDAIGDASPRGRVTAAMFGHESPEMKAQFDRLKQEQMRTETMALALDEQRSQAARRPILQQREDELYKARQAEIADTAKIRGENIKQEGQRTDANDEAMSDKLLADFRQAATKQMRGKLTAAFDAKYGRGVGGQGMTDDEVASVLTNNPNADDFAELWTAGNLAELADRGDAKAKRAFEKHLRASNITLETGKDGKQELVDHDSGTRLPYGPQTFASAWDASARPAADEMAGRLMAVNNARNAAGRALNGLSAAAVSRGLISPSEVGTFQLLARDSVMGGQKLDKTTPKETLQQLAKETGQFQMLNKMSELTQANDPTVKSQLSQQIMAELADGGVELFGGQIVPQITLAKGQDMGQLDIANMKVKFIPQNADPRVKPWEGTLSEFVQDQTAKNPVASRLADMFRGLALRKSQRDAALAAKTDKPSFWTDPVTFKRYEVKTVDGEHKLFEVQKEDDQGDTSTPTDADVLNFAKDLIGN